MMKMSFKDWVLEEDQKSLARNYTDLLRNVPQDPTHHPEGDALTHIRLVRKAIPEAINKLSFLKSTPQFSEILGDIDFRVSSEELQILYIAAWLHDIGKSSATTVGGMNYSFLRQMDLSYQNDPSKIKAIGHDKSSHYAPLIKGLEPVAPEETKSLYLRNKETIDFIIDYHMSFRKGEGFSGSFIKRYFNNGKVVNDQKVKLLLIIMWADKMGRTPDASKRASLENEESLLDSSKKSLKQSLEQKSKDKKALDRRASISDPASMVGLLRSKGLQNDQIMASVRRKFPDLDDKELIELIGN